MKKRASDLEDFINEEVTCEIECSKCGKDEIAYDDFQSFMKELFKKGWRATKKNCYCPKCAKRYLK